MKAETLYMLEALAREHPVAARALALIRDGLDCEDVLIMCVKVLAVTNAKLVADVLHSTPNTHFRVDRENRVWFVPPDREAS